MTKHMKNQIKAFWLSRWDYISLTDAIIETRNAGYTEPKIRDLKQTYNEIEVYQ